MKQQDWIDFFQAVHGRNPSIQEMAEAANRGEFIRETPKQTVEATKNLSQKETVETAENDVDNYDVAEEPLADTNLEELQDLPNTSPASSQTNATFQHPNHNFNETWTQHESKSQTNLIMLAIADIPFIIWALGIYLIGVASDEVGATLPLALFLLIFSLPFVALIILPALLNKTDKKWLIFVLSILLNWTFIGWVILLVVSINMNKEAERIKQQQMMMQMAGEQGNSNMFNPFH